MADLTRNLAAVCMAAASFFLWSGGAAALTANLATTSSGSTVLLLQGSIEPGDAERVFPMLTAGGFREVWIDSPGGSVSDAYILGYAIRDRGLITRIPDGAICASACVDLFAGGVVRFVDPGGDVVVHTGTIIYADFVQEMMASSVADGDITDVFQFAEQASTSESAIWAQYLGFMGVSTDLITFAASAPQRCSIFLTPLELVYFNIVNTAGAPPNGYRPGEPDVFCPEPIEADSGPQGASVSENPAQPGDAPATQASIDPDPAAGRQSRRRD